MSRHAPLYVTARMLRSVLDRYGAELPELSFAASSNGELSIRVPLLSADEAGRRHAADLLAGALGMPPPRVDDDGSYASYDRRRLILTNLDCAARWQLCRTDYERPSLN